MGTCDAELRTAQQRRWDQTIDRRLVHRNSVAEVLLTDLARLGETDFSIAAQWPRSHRVYRLDRDGRHDPMLLLETVRQAGLAVSHFGFGVGFDQQSMMRDVGFELDPKLEPRAVLAATNVSVALNCTDIIRRGDALRGMTVQLRFFTDDTLFATGSGSIRWVSVHTYSALRARSGPMRDPAGGARPTEPAPLPVRRPSPFRAADDALIAAAPGRPDDRQVVVPLDHPVYFDHPLDHAPGMLLIDAAWQAAMQLRGDTARLVECVMECPVFTELGVETHIRLAPAAADTTRFSVVQDGRSTASGMLRVAV